MKQLLSNVSITINLSLFSYCAAFIGLFCFVALIDLSLLSRWVDIGFSWSVRWFGLYWQMLLLLNFFIGIIICLMPGSNVKLGGQQPEFNHFQWGSMIMCTLLAGGGVFWAAGEPMAYFLSMPPLFEGTLTEQNGIEAARVALAQSFLHWGFLAWAILGSLATIMLMHYHYDKGLPLAPRTLLYSIFGDRVINGHLGNVVDAACIISVVAGTVGPIGFLGLQVAYGLDVLVGIDNGFASQTTVIASLMLVYIISSITGLSKGIQLLSRFNIVLGVGLLLFILVAGPTQFIFSNFFSSMGVYLNNFFDMAMYRGDAGWFGESGWLSWWTLFFWGWFIGYGPLMAIFIARISKGRSARTIIIMLSIIAPLVTNFWFSILGGTGLAFELNNPNVISSALEGFNLPAILLAITQLLPFGLIISLLFIVLTIIFVATTSDSMTYAIALSMTKQNSKQDSSGDVFPPLWVKLFWGIAMGVMAWILIIIDGGSVGITKLQSFIVITAVPVSLVLLPSLWDAVRIIRQLKE